MYKKIKEMNITNEYNYKKERKNLPYDYDYFYIEEKKNGFYIYSTNKYDKPVYLAYDILALICWFKENPWCFLINVSDLYNNIHKFKTVTLDESTFKYITKCFSNIFINTLYFLKKSRVQIAKMALQGFILIENFNDVLFIFNKGNDYYVVSSYDIVLRKKEPICLKTDFSMSGVYVTNYYIDNLYSFIQDIFFNWFRYNKCLNKVVLNKCIIDLNNLKSMFSRCDCLEYLDISGLASINGKIEDIEGLCWCCFSLKRLILPKTLSKKGLVSKNFIEGCPDDLQIVY